MEIRALDHSLHLWLLDPGAVLASDLADASAGMLSNDEVRRWKRYIRTEDRHVFLTAHVFVRRVLSLYADVAPGEWTFVTNEYGRPEVAQTPQTQLRFNLSHTDGLVALLVHDHVDAGVDVERIGRVDDPLAMSATVFADQERATLEGPSPAELDASFCRLWTLKESFIKAKGMGLAIPLKDFWFSIDDRLEISVDCLPTVDPDPGAWQFALVEPTPTHLVAVARAAPGRTLDVHWPSPQELLFGEPTTV